MDNQEIEKKLQESVDNVETREFSEVWGEIKDRIEMPSKRKSRRWIPAVASVACAAAVCAVAIPLALHYGSDAPVTQSSSTQSSSEKRYFHDKLFLENVTFEVFTTSIQQSEIACVDFSDYEIFSSAVYKTEDDFVAGGKLELANESSYFILQLYADNVVVDMYSNVVYDLSYTANGTVIEYRLKEANSGTYKYDIKAQHNGTQYYIEYTCFSEDIQPFLTSFFQ